MFSSSSIVQANDEKSMPLKLKGEEECTGAIVKSISLQSIKFGGSGLGMRWMEVYSLRVSGSLNSIFNSWDGAKKGKEKRKRERGRKRTGERERCMNLIWMGMGHWWEQCI